MIDYIHKPGTIVEESPDPEIDDVLEIRVGNKKRVMLFDLSKDFLVY